jgi:methionine-rich copper-binding protein CopC
MRTLAQGQIGSLATGMRRFLLIGASLLLLSGTPAHAHADLERAEPPAGGTVRNPPNEVAIWFTQKLEPAFSAIAVRNAAGQRVDAGRTRVTGNVMRVPLKAIGPGNYQVSWRVLSVDTHRTQGTFRFRVSE